MSGDYWWDPLYQLFGNTEGATMLPEIAESFAAGHKNLPEEAEAYASHTTPATAGGQKLEKWLGLR